MTILSLVAATVPVTSLILTVTLFFVSGMLGLPPSRAVFADQHNPRLRHCMVFQSLGHPYHPPQQLEQRNRPTQRHSPQRWHLVRAPERSNRSLFRDLGPSDHATSKPRRSNAVEILRHSIFRSGASCVVGTSLRLSHRPYHCCYER